MLAGRSSTGRAVNADAARTQIALAVRSCPPNRSSPSRHDSDRLGRPRIGATFFLGLAAAAGAPANAGCGRASTVLAYRGTASLQTSGASTPELDLQVVELTSCPAAFRGWQDFGDGRDPRPPARGVLSVGDECTLFGTMGGAGNGTFLWSSAPACVLRFAGQSRKLEVTDATVRFGSRGAWVDHDVVDVDIGGDLATDRRHVLLHFRGSPTSPGGHGRCEAGRGPG